MSSPSCLPFVVALVGLTWFLIRLSGDIQLNPGPKRDFRILYSNVRGLFTNRNELKAASAHYDIILCAETIVSDYRHNSELLLPHFNKPWLIRRDALPRSRGMSVYIRSGFTASRHKDAECGCHEVMVTRVCSKYNNLYVFSCYRNTDLDDAIFDCLKESMARVQERDPKSCFVFVGDLNVHHREWLQSRSPTDGHGIAALNFTNETGCEQLVNEPTHISGNCLDLFITDVPGICRVSVEPQIGTSDHFSVAARVTLNSPLPDLTVSKRVHLMSRVNWDAVENAINTIAWPDILHNESPVERLNVILCDIINRFIPSKIIKFRTKDRPWFTEACRVAYQRKQQAFHRWSRDRTPDHWEDYRRARNHASRTCNLAENAYNIHIREKLANSSNSRSWWRTSKNSIVGAGEPSTPLKKADGSLTFAADEKAKLLSDHFNSKMSRGDIEIPPGCYPEPKLTSIAFRSSELKKILDDLDAHGSVDPNGLFPSLFKRFSSILAPKLAVLFRLTIQSGAFPNCWKIASITPIPKEGASCNAKDYRPISITPILSKVFEKLLARRLNSFIETEGILPSTQFGYRKNLGTTDALLTFSHDIQAALRDGMEVRAVAIDFSAAFDKVNHRGIVHNLQNIGVGGRFLDLCRSFLSSRRQFVSVDGCASPTSDVYSGVPQGSVLGPIFFVLYTASLLTGLSCLNVAYADDTTIYVVIPKPADRARLALKLKSDLQFIKEWCRLWGMELNPSKTKSIIFSRSRTDVPEHPNIMLENTIIENVEALRLLGVIFDPKLTFQSHISTVTRIVSQKIGILRKCWQTYRDDSIVLKTFYSFILPFFEYCSPVWMSAASSHLQQLQRVFNAAKFITPIGISLDHRRDVAAMCLFYKILSRDTHPMNSRLPGPANGNRRTRRANRMNSRALTSAVTPHSVQFNRTYVPYIIEMWNFLPQVVVDASNVDSFKRLVNRHLLSL